MRGHSNVTMCEWLINSFITFFVIGWFTFSGPWRLRRWYPNKERRLHASQKKYHFALRADFKGKFFQNVFSGSLIYLAAVNYWNFYLSNSTWKLAYRTLKKKKKKRDNFYSLTVDIVSSEFRQCYCITTIFLRQNISLGTVQNNKVGCEKQSGWANRKEKTDRRCENTWNLWSKAQKWSENNKKMVKRKDDKEGRERGYRAGNAAERVKGK